MAINLNSFDSLYKNWLLAGLGLKYFKEGIHELVKTEIELYHKELMDHMSTRLSRTGIILDTSTQTYLPFPGNKQPPMSYVCNIVLCSQCGVCTSLCPNALCRDIMKYMKLTHLRKRPIWGNTDPGLWSMNPMEVAKCFLSTDGYINAGSVEDIDCAGLLSIVINMEPIRTHLKLCYNDFEAFEKVCISLYNLMQMTNEQLMKHIEPFLEQFWLVVSINDLDLAIV